MFFHRMSRNASFWSSFSLNERTQRGLFALVLFFFSALLVFGMIGSAGWFGASIDRGFAYLFGWDQVLFPLVFAAWGYHVLKPDIELFQPRTVLGLVLLFLGLNPLVHIWTFGSATVPDAAIVDAGGKFGQWGATALFGFIGMAGSITFLVALLLAALMLVFHVGMEDVLFFLKYVWRGLVWAWQSASTLFQHWKASRVVIEHAHIPSSVMDVSLDDEVPSQEEADTHVNASDEEHTIEIEEDREEDVEKESEEIEEPKKLVKKRVRRIVPRVEVPLDMFDLRDQKPNIGNPKQTEELIRKTLASFGIPVESAGYNAGPTVTQYMVKPSEGIKVSRIVALQNDLALSLSAQSLRIEAPIPGKPYVGIEVPNQTVALVGMREMLESKEFRDRKHGLVFVLGKDVAGKASIADLSKMPHVLVAGATGSGKSVCLNAMMMSFLYAHHPDDVKLIMVDPKRVEMQMYNGIPHLLTPVITDIPEAVNALKWALREMTRRYGLLPSVNAKNIADYNARVPQEEHIPWIVFVIDELADLMMTAKQEIEGPIVRLCQMARAVGIHLVLATQRPSVDVITGLIKANVPARIAFSVASSVDSKTILDQVGADRLLGRGDMLFSTSELPSPRRVQGAFISDQEIVRVVDFLKMAYGPGEYDLSVTERREGSSTVLDDADNDEEQDVLLNEAWNEVFRAGRASASLLQRRLKVGYSRAARILDEMEQQGWIGPENGSKGRELLRKVVSEQMPLPVVEGEEF